MAWSDSLGAALGPGEAYGPDVEAVRVATRVAPQQEMPLHETLLRIEESTRLTSVTMEHIIEGLEALLTPGTRGQTSTPEAPPIPSRGLALVANSAFESSVQVAHQTARLENLLQRLVARLGAPL